MTKHIEGKENTQHNTEVIDIEQSIIDIVWEATDGGYKLSKGSFSHFGEPLSSLQELNTKLTTLLQSNTKAVEERVEKNIGILRQWLNEDRITETNKMVDNKEIKVMLGLTNKAE